MRHSVVTDTINPIGNISAAIRLVYNNPRRHVIIRFLLNWYTWMIYMPCIAWESWPDSSEYVLFLNVFHIKLCKYVFCSNLFESTITRLQYNTIYHELSRSNLPCCINALLRLEYRPCLNIFVILAQHVETGYMKKLPSLRFVTPPSSITTFRNGLIWISQ